MRGSKRIRTEDIGCNMKAKGVYQKPDMMIIVLEGKDVIAGSGDIELPQMP